MKRVLPAAASAAGLLLLAALAVPGPAFAPPARADTPPAAQVGRFGPPFAEPGPSCPHEAEGSTGPATAQPPDCKPAAVSVVILPNGRVLYWDGLEAMESVHYGVAAEFGDVAGMDQSRVMDLHGSWETPDPSDGGANANGYDSTYLVPDAPPPLNEVLNDPGNAPGALFCSSQVILRDGTVLVAGGTNYYSEPHVPGTPYGVAELEGLRNSRLFLPRSNRWIQSGWMHHGRWYPTLVTLANGDVFVASGVTKLVKPLYPETPEDSGRNVVQTETYHLGTRAWTSNGTGGDRSLPLFPRLHLLPDGKVYYDAGGQTFNPFGQAYDEALWNEAAAYDPAARTWTDLGTPALAFRGSAFSVMLPLRAPYAKASFLSAGGVFGTTPGSYVANPTSQIDTVDTAHGDAFSSELTGMLNNARWYSTAVVLPTGQVIAFSGADRDEVDAPGSGFPVAQAELFDPATKTWAPLASGTDDRTYHNTAVLLPDGRVLVGGHSPIGTGYGAQTEVPGGFSNPWRDPSFEVYSPPYLFWGPRPAISNAPDSVGYRGTFTIRTPDAARIGTVALVRNPALTHLTDADQRVVDLRIVSRSAGSVTVARPPSGALAPPGPYLLFVNARSDRGLIPSVARQVFVGGRAPAWTQAG